MWQCNYLISVRMIFDMIITFLCLVPFNRLKENSAPSTANLLEEFEDEEDDLDILREERPLEDSQV